MMQPFYVDSLGRWSYPAVILPYYVLLLSLLWYFRVTFRFSTWKCSFAYAVNALLILGFGFELMADVFRVWDFDPARDLFWIRIPVFGWITGHMIPICEALWIVAVVPLFYYLYLWHTFVFHDIIYVVDEKGGFYKKEERWVGLFSETRILTRPKGFKDRKYETVICVRKPGFIAKTIKRFVKEKAAEPAAVAE